MQRKPQGRGYSPNPAAAGRGNKSEQLGRRASPSQAMRPSEISPARQTVGFKTADERLLFAAQLLIGYTVQVQVNSGKVYEGIFHTADLDSKDASVVLKMARVIKDPAVSEDDGLAPAKPVSSQVIHAADLVQVIAVDVRMGAADVGPLGGDDAGGFGTDSAISRGRGGQAGRELQRWTPEGGEGEALGGLEDIGVPVERGWDQFALNETKFGVRTDYAEELYTTELDLSKSKISLEEANRIAAEIERGDTSNIHLMEERGRLLDDSQVDEEERYGAVIRQPPPPSVARPSALSAAAAAAATNGTQPTRSAWGGSRSAAAALFPGGPSGGTAGAAQQPSAPPRAAAPSAPINIDRKEINKAVQQVTEPKSKSPYGTPKSPLQSPLVSDVANLDALNLHRGVPAVAEETRQEFLNYKLTAGSQSTQLQRPLVKEFKEFSQKLGAKLSGRTAKAGGEGEGEGSAAGATASTSAASTPPASSAGARPPQPPAAGAAAAAPPGAGSKLNPFAKSFTFNINAKEFKPTVEAGAAPAPAAPPAAAPAGPATPPTPAGSGGSVATAAGGALTVTTPPPPAAPGDGPSPAPAAAPNPPPLPQGGDAPGPPPVPASRGDWRREGERPPPGAVPGRERRERRYDREEHPGRPGRYHEDRGGTGRHGPGGVGPGGMGVDAPPPPPPPAAKPHMVGAHPGMPGMQQLPPGTMHMVGGMPAGIPYMAGQHVMPAMPGQMYSAPVFTYVMPSQPMSSSPGARPPHPAMYGHPPGMAAGSMMPTPRMYPPGAPPQVYLVPMGGMPPGAAPPPHFQPPPPPAVVGSPGSQQAGGQ